MRAASASPLLQSAVRQPNIVFIVMDATRAQNLSVYGYPRRTTPHLEEFAETNVVYENAIAASYWSLPCHASLFTGLYPSAHGADDQHQFLDPAHPIIGEYLQRHGYRTVAFCTKRDISVATGMDRGFQKFNPVIQKRPFEHAVRKLERGVGKVTGTRDNGLGYTTAQVKKLLPQLKADGAPFFLFLSTVESHIPYRPPQKHNTFLPRHLSHRRAARVNMDRWKYMAGQVEMDAEDFEVLRALYDAGIAYTDARLAELFAWLRELELWDNLLLIITADHGENLGEHALMAHGFCLYDTVVRVPLLLHYPKGTVSSGRVKHQVQAVDILPTILNLLGENIRRDYPHLRGNDLLSSARHPFAVAEQANPDLAPFRTRFPQSDMSRYNRYLRMIRTETHKYIWGSDGKHELYDLNADPGETRNLIHSQAELAMTLEARLCDWLAASLPSYSPPSVMAQRIEV